jgi:hypothetical protein
MILGWRKRSASTADSFSVSHAVTVLAREAADHYRHLLEQHREELVSKQAPGVDDAAAKLTQTLDGLEGQVDQFATEVGVLQGLHNPHRQSESRESVERMRSLGRRPSVDVPSFDPDPATVIRGHLSALRAEVEELRRDATPLRQRILDAIGAGPTTWDDVVATLAIAPLDDEACAMRGFMLADQAIEWCDPQGNPIVPGSVMAGAGVVVAQQRCLRRNDNPPLSPTQQARREAAGRAA